MREMNLQSKIKNLKAFLQSDQTIILCSHLVVVFSVILAMPAFTIPLGLPPEGDAVDYRVPLIKWIIRHHSYPNWSWSLVDDYPSLG